MYARDITPDEFEAIAADLVKVTHQEGAIDVVRGRHKDYGYTVLLRDGTRCLALVDAPSLLDAKHAENAFTAECATLGGAMRTSRH